ncbi:MULTISPECIES: hypothetical protein [Moorena]|uniref:Uncharacterized protein n=1 Tax=Moorena producens (strain JHB) TaxID=1454205 RepID=A0A9Q9UWV1_MOOP1|nr:MULTISPECIES: hypothetical protein [Moorena]WAN70281.1 hypothetical protein BJP36_38720 [Moorena producens JHB]
MTVGHATRSHFCLLCPKPKFYDYCDTVPVFGRSLLIGIPSRHLSLPTETVVRC